MAADRPRSLALAALVVVAALYVAALGLVGVDGFWIGDNAVKYLQVLAVQQQGLWNPALIWAGAELDPGFQANPLPFPFTLVRDGRLLAQYPPVFAVVSSVPYRLFGKPGLFVLPLVASIVLLAGVARIAGLLHEAPRVRHGAVILAGLCTPVWFYSAVFWEHALGACLAIWAVVFHLRHQHTGSARHLAVSSALAAAGVWFREEQLLLSLLLAALATSRPGRRGRTLLVSGAVTAAVLAPFAAFLWVTTGSPFGLHAAANVASPAAHLFTRGTVFYNLLLASDRSVVLSLSFTLPCLLLFVWNPRVDDARFKAAASICGLIAVVGGALSVRGYSVAASPIEQLLAANSLFPAAPVIILGLIRPAASGARAVARRRLWAIALGSAVLYALAAPEISSGGIHWGNRFLLPLYPLLAAVAAANIRHWFAVANGESRSFLVATSVIILSFGAQLYSLHLLDEKRQFSRHLNEAVRARPEPAIVTDLWWVGAELYSILGERPVFYVSSTEALTTLTRRLAQRGDAELLLVRRAPAIRPPGLAIVGDGDLDFFELALEPWSAESPP